MNKSAITGLLVAMVFPLVGYFIVKHYGEAAVQMPHKYFYDSVATVEKNGKLTTDTFWHKVSNITFTNQLGKKVSLDDLKGKILVVDFFFSRCPSICPGMAKSMRRLQTQVQALERQPYKPQFLHKLYLLRLHFQTKTTQPGTLSFLSLAHTTIFFPL